MFKLLAGLFALLGAILWFLEARHANRPQATRNWFSDKWRSIDSCRWLYLPEKTIGAFLDVKDGLLLKLSNMMKRKQIRFIIIVISATGITIAFWTIARMGKGDVAIEHTSAQPLYLRVIGLISLGSLALSTFWSYTNFLYEAFVEHKRHLKLRPSTVMFTAFAFVIGTFALFLNGTCQWK